MAKMPTVNFRKLPFSSRILFPRELASTWKGFAFDQSSVIYLSNSYLTPPYYHLHYHWNDLMLY